jgi:gas vesicle protein
MQKANNIDTHFSALMQQVSSEFQEQFKALEGSSNHGEEELNGESKKLSHAIDTFSIETEASMNEFFRGVLEGHNKNLDNSLSSIAQDLSSVHDATTEKLSEQTRQLSSNLVTASGEAREGLSTRCQDLRDKVDTMLAAFIARMDEKVKTSLVLRENLEKEKDSIFTGIRGELAQIKAGYEKKLTNLMNEGVNRVNTIASDCERDMQAAHERCQSQLKSDAQTMRDDIEKEIQEFTQMLTTVRTATLDEIAKSAGAAGQDQKASDNRSGRRTRKKDESSDTEG